MRYVVYTEIFGDTVERWYYGTYESDRANEVAMMLGSGDGVFHCVCALEDAKAMGIRNLP